MPRAGGIGGHGPAVGGGADVGVQEEVKAGSHCVGGVLVQESLEDVGGEPAHESLEGCTGAVGREDVGERDRRRPDKSMP